MYSWTVLWEKSIAKVVECETYSKTHCLKITKCVTWVAALKMPRGKILKTVLFAKQLTWKKMVYIRTNWIGKYLWMILINHVVTTFLFSFWMLQTGTTFTSLVFCSVRLLDHGNPPIQGNVFPLACPGSDETVRICDSWNGRVGWSALGERTTSLYCLLIWTKYQVTTGDQN